MTRDVDMRAVLWRAECARDAGRWGDGRTDDEGRVITARGARGESSGICALSRIWGQMRSGRQVVAVPVRSCHARKAHSVHTRQLDDQTSHLHTHRGHATTRPELVAIQFEISVSTKCEFILAAGKPESTAAKRVQET